MQEVDLTLVFDLEVGGDQRWGLTSDPSGEWLGALSLIVLYYLDLKGREDKSQLFSQHKYTQVHIKDCLWVSQEEWLTPMQDFHTTTTNTSAATKHMNDEYLSKPVAKKNILVKLGDDVTNSC